MPAGHYRGGVTTDPLAPLLDLPGVTDGVARAREAVDGLLGNRVLRRRSGDVSAEQRDGKVEVAVADTGRGIAARNAERIFEEFQQADGAEEGTGLGLPLARRFVELHGGRLWLESSVGEGSTFRFELPVTQREASWASSS